MGDRDDGTAEELARRVRALEEELAALRTSRDALQHLLESVPDFVGRTTRDGQITYINRLAPGFTMADALGANILDFTDPAYHDAMRATIAQVLATGESAGLESIAAGAGGQPRDYYTRLAPIVRDGRITEITVVATDVTSVKATVRALAEREQRIELAVRAADLGYWHWDARTDVVTWDEVTCRHFGIGPSEAVTTYAGFLARVVACDRERIRTEVDDSVARGHYAGLRFRTVTLAGEERWLMTAGSVERDAAGQVRGLIGCLLDITAPTRLEEHLQQAQRMDAVGQLAAGVAHNFNNLLAAILPAIELAARRSPDTAALLGDVREAAVRSADVVRQLMAFAGGSAPTGPAQPCDAGEVARRVVQLASAVIDRGVELRLTAPAQPLTVRVDAGALEQALMNLVINARDALEAAETATPTIRVEVALAQLPEGPVVRLTVADNGPGMTESTRRRAIEPFFTTKPPGRGTGLGLSSTYAMVTAAGGRLQLDPAPGGGTVATLSLPGAAAIATPVDTAAPALQASGERILVVDDEDAVRRVVAAVLRDAGYTVDEASGPAVALERFGAAPSSYDLILLDESMPGMSGSAVLARMLAIAPATRVISFSGLDRRLPGARAHVAKPVSIDKLLAVVGRVLAGLEPPA